MIPKPLTLRFTWLLLPIILVLQGACQPAPAISAGGMGVTLSSPLAARVPLQTPLALRYSAALAGYASLYAVGSSGQVVQLFVNRSIPASTLQDFPGRSDPVIRFGPPAGTERFILVATAQPFHWLSSTDYVDATTYPRLAMDATNFESRLTSALATLSPGTYQVQRLFVTTF